jgi:Putative MetA-pathway of phenol degradation
MKIVAAFIVMILLTASGARGQDTLRDAVTVLMTNQAVQTNDFARDRAAAEAARDTIANALLVNLATAPIATSSGGFLYRVNRELGTVERASETFGSFFVDRALTAGQGNVSFGLSATTATFGNLNGFDLQDGTLVTVANRFRDEAAPFDTESLSMELRASTVTLLANVGVTNNFDVAVALPMARITLDGQRLNVYRGQQFVQAVVTGSATGFTDLAIRAKYAFLSTPGGGVAAAGEVRLPTGDQENLLGAGEMSWRVIGVGSIEHGPLSLHANAGFVRGGISDETIFTGAAAVAAHPRVTVTGEFLGRHVSALRDFTLASAPHTTLAGVDTSRLVSGVEGVTLMTAVAGVKWNVGQTLVLGGHILFPLTDRGLTSNFAPTITFEYALQ